jgi:hypothetical protein
VSHGADFNFKLSEPFCVIFIFTASLSEIEHEIDTRQIILSSLPRFHPRRPELLRALAQWRYNHFKISASRGQLDESIIHLTETLLLARTGSTPATARYLYSLANSLHFRWERFKQPDDIKYYVNYLRYLKEKRLQVDISHDFITSRLVRALEEQVVSQWRSDNVMENIKEMVILCLELLNSDNLLLAIDAFSALFHVMVERYNARREYQDQVIECFREANIRFPYSSELSFYLGRWNRG